ncbi:hypothetical protein FQZ97_807920 [compost metagenome]
MEHSALRYPAAERGGPVDGQRAGPWTTAASPSGSGSPPDGMPGAAISPGILVDRETLVSVELDDDDSGLLGGGAGDRNEADRPGIGNAGAGAGRVRYGACSGWTLAVLATGMLVPVGRGQAANAGDDFPGEPDDTAYAARIACTSC